MIPMPIHDWRLFLQDGQQFLQTARAAHRKKSKAFSPEAIYNLTCMGIEKLVMAFLMHRGDLAENHTMIDLLHALGQHLEVDDHIASRMIYLNSFQEICDLDAFATRVPDADELESIVACGRELQVFLASHF